MSTKRIRQEASGSGAVAQDMAAARQARDARSQASQGDIISAAEKLFADRGVDVVSLIEIAEAAGQKNRSAVQYHFGDKQGLIGAIRQKHQSFIEPFRVEMLDRLEACEEATLRDFVEVLILPLSDRLMDPDGGSAYVRLGANLIGHPSFGTSSPEARAQSTPARLFGHLARRAQPLPPSLLQSRILLVTGMVFHGLSDWSRLPENKDGVDRKALDDFVQDLVTCVMAVLETPTPES